MISHSLILGELINFSSKDLAYKETAITMQSQSLWIQFYILIRSWMFELRSTLYEKMLNLGNK